MHRHQEHVLVLRQAHQRRAQQRPRRQVERLRRLRQRPGLQAVRGVERDAWERPRRRCMNPLHRVASDGHEGRAQRLVALDHGLDGLAQRLEVEPTANAERRRDIVRRAARLQLIEEPQALLRKRQRQRIRPRLRHQRRHCRPARCARGGSILPAKQLDQLRLALGQQRSQRGREGPLRRAHTERFSVEPQLDAETLHHRQERAELHRKTSHSRTSSSSERVDSSEMIAASAASVGASNSVLSASSTLNAARMRDTTCVAKSEWPPISKN